MQCGAAVARALAEPCCSGRRLEAAQTRYSSGLLPARPAGRAGRRQLRTAALLGELDLPTAASSLQASLPHFAHLPAAAADQLAALAAQPGVSHDTLAQLLTLGDAAAQRIADLADAAAAAAEPAKKDNGWLQPLVTALETVLTFIEDGLKKLNVPYSYGWSIVALTAVIKLVTFPLTKKQVESALNIQKLKPQIDAIKAQYGENKDAIQRETQALYDKAGIDPLAGCLPSLATIPIFIGLFRSLQDFASQEEAGSAAFYWIPSLAGPTSVAAQKAGAGTAWLFPFVDGAPPIGWDLASRYLALPVALVIAQYISNAIVQPPQTDDSDAAKFSQNLVKVLPLMIGWFALNVPSGLSLYYFANTVFTAAQQIYLKKLGGANLAEYDLGPIELGKARRTGTVAESVASLDAGDAAATQNGGVAAATAAIGENGAAASLASASMSATASSGDEAEAPGAAVLAAAAAPAAPKINRRCKRRRRELLEVTA